MTDTTKFDLTVLSTVIRSEKPNKPLEAIAAANTHQMNRVIGYLPDGTKAVVAQRPGKGGMDFNKLLTGKVFAVAADALSPVMEKNEKNEPTDVQKTEDGLPLYSSSGFYLLSSKEYPALKIVEGYTKLLDGGAHVLIMTEEQKADRHILVLNDDMDWLTAETEFEAALGNDNNLVAEFDAAMNRKRNRTIDNAIKEAEDAEDDEVKYEGVAFKELSVSGKDGMPFVSYRWRSATGQSGEGLILRVQVKVDEDSDNGLPRMFYLSAEEAVEEFRKTPEYKALMAELNAGNKVKLAYVSGHLMRTSVSFRRKVENVLAAPADKPKFGDAVYIQSAMNDWVKGIVAIMHTMHPKFPAADYDAHYYVAAPRQAEIGMNRQQSGKGWLPPEALVYKLAA